MVFWVNTDSVVLNANSILRPLQFSPNTYARSCSGMDKLDGVPKQVRTMLASTLGTRSDCCMNSWPTKKSSRALVGRSRTV
jgi:hypothetical protein